MSFAVIVKELDVNQPAQLWRRYPGRSEPQKCYLELDTRTGELSCCYRHDVLVDPERAHQNGLILSTEIEPLIPEAANDLMYRVEHYAQQVMDGSASRREGEYEIGVLTPDAKSAWEELVEIARPGNFDARWVVDERMVDEWHENDPDGGIARLGITADLTNVELGYRADSEVARAATGVGLSYPRGYIVLDREDELAHLKRLRDGLREAARAELAAVAARIEAGQRRREELIRQIRGWGLPEDTYRALSQLANVSKSEVGRIVEQDQQDGPLKLGGADHVAPVLHTLASRVAKDKALDEALGRLWPAMANTDSPEKVAMHTSLLTNWLLCSALPLWLKAAGQDDLAAELVEAETVLDHMVTACVPLLVRINQRFDDRFGPTGTWVSRISYYDAEMAVFATAAVAMSLDEHTSLPRTAAGHLFKAIHQIVRRCVPEAQHPQQVADQVRESLIRQIGAMLA